MRLLLAKKRSPRRFHSRAEPGVFAITATWEVTRPQIASHSHDFLGFIWSQNTSAALTLLASPPLSSVSQLFNPPIFSSFPLCLRLSSFEMTGIAKWFTRHSSPFVSQIYVFRQRENFYVPNLTTLAKQSFYKVSAEFDIFLYTFLFSIF